ncbi:MAG: hypothetical protein KGH69_04065 [Candidatus Micrarchaeota archaeon]|nr:hypothetical protein [Candidatus Micrarchaeota archaeon]
MNKAQRWAAASVVAGAVAIELNSYKGFAVRLKGAFRRIPLSDTERKFRAIDFYEKMLELNERIATAKDAFHQTAHNGQYYGYNPFQEQLREVMRVRDRLVRDAERQGYFSMLADITAEADQRILRRR